MLARESGINGGRAGSMNVNSPGDRLIGSFGIVGGSIAAATGAALALKRTTGGVAVAYFGDGAMNQGYVFECLNFCQVLKLPLLFVCENNGYGEYTPFRSVTAGEIRARAEIMDVPAETIDGMSVWLVRGAASRALEHVRERQDAHTRGAFLFPQMTLDGPAGCERDGTPWSPRFIDYVFLAFNTSTAFSPTDAPVLDRWAKVLMMTQAVISLTIIALLIGRGVNIL